MWWIERAAAPQFQEQSDRWTLSVDLPGAKREDVQVRVEEGALTLDAKRDTRSQGRLLHGERRDWSLRHSWALPAGVDGDAVTATLSEGVLTLSVRKPEPLRPHRIEVAVL